MVGYDGSVDAELALRWALGTAEQSKAPLRVVVAAADGEGLPAAVRAHEKSVAHDTAARARDLVASISPLDADVRVEHGWALPVLMRLAEDAELVVVGSRGHHRLDRGWIGSVSQHLVGRVDCPVVVVRPSHNPTVRKIVVGIDGSPSSVRALRWAAERASATGEHVLAVNAFHQPAFALHGAIGALPDDLDLSAADDAERLAEELVAEVAADFPGLDIRGTTAAGRAARVLARLSDDASAVVVGSRGRTPVQALVLGSVAHETLHRAACPVVVVP